MLREDEIKSLAAYLRETVEEQFEEDIHAVLAKGIFEKIIKDWQETKKAVESDLEHPQILKMKKELVGAKEEDFK